MVYDVNITLLIDDVIDEITRNSHEFLQDLCFYLNNLLMRLISLQINAYNNGYKNKQQMFPNKSLNYLSKAILHRN